MRVDKFLILVPLVAMVGLTFLVWVYLYALRLPYMYRKKIDPELLKLGGAEADALLREVDNPSDNFINLFELPVLFYVAVFSLVALDGVTSVELTLAWAFVLLRSVHSFIHCTYNRVVHRFIAYALSTFSLIALWIFVAVRVGENIR